MQPHDAVVTLWFVNVSDPAAVLNAGPKADRGFGRKYLALMNPSWPISVFGEFPLNRSVSASKGEFYIAGYPGVTVVQTFLEEMTVLSELPTKLLNSIEARDVYAFAENGDTSFGGIAHWQGGELRRSFCARRDRVYEDIGLPEPFEAPLWAGKLAASTCRLSRLTWSARQTRTGSASTFPPTALTSQWSDTPSTAAKSHAYRRPVPHVQSATWSNPPPPSSV